MPDWSKISPERFEKLCSDLLQQDGFYNIRRVGGSGDRGRDILANKQMELFQGIKENQTWVIQCKRYAATKLSVDELNHELTQARAHKPDYFALITCSNLLSSVIDWLESVKNDFNFKIKILDIDWLENQLRKQPYLIKEYFENIERKRTFEINDNNDLQIYTAGKMPTEAVRGALTWWREELQKEILKSGKKIGFYHPEFVGCDHTGIYLSETVLSDYQMVAQSNLIIAYLEENEQYGTITEIMIGYAMNKQIAIFIDENVNIEMIHKTADSEFEDCSEEYEKIFKTSHKCTCMLWDELLPIHYNNYWFLIEFLRQKDSGIHIAMTNKDNVIKDMTKYMKSYLK